VTNPASELSAAADRLESLANLVEHDLATNGYWGTHGTPDARYSAGVRGGLGDPAGLFAAVMNPGVAHAIAEWLNSLVGVDFSEFGPMPEELEHALAIARLIAPAEGA
jgi:hypothetical protein